MKSLIVQIVADTPEGVEYGFAFATENPIYATTIDKSLLDGVEDRHYLEFFPDENRVSLAQVYSNK